MRCERQFDLQVDRERACYCTLNQRGRLFALPTALAAGAIGGNICQCEPR